MSNTPTVKEMEQSLLALKLIWSALERLDLRREQYRKENYLLKSGEL